MSESSYTVHRIADDRMPKGCEWALVEIPAAPGRPAEEMILVAESAFVPSTFADVWAAGRYLKRNPPRPVPVPMLRVV